MTQAELSASQGYCKRLQVGAVIVKDKRMIVEGRNGTISGQENKCEKMNGHGEMKTHAFVVHAEANAILFAAKNGISTDGCTMYVTHAPCTECSKMIAQSGIKKLVYKNDYNCLDGVNFLKTVGVEVYKLKRQF